MNFVPKEMFFTKGVGKHKNNLESFELALRDAGIAACNLVKVSSIMPPGCKLISKEEGLQKLLPGQITFCVMAEQRCDEPNRLICSGIGLAIPAESNEQHGYISEHHGFGMTSHQISDYVEDMAASMLASTLGVEFDPNLAYDQRKEIYQMSGKIVRTKSFVQTAECDKSGLWTTVVTAVVFLF